MRIGIDARYLSHGLVGGIHTYLESLMPALLESAHEHQIFLYADTKRPFELAALPDWAQVRQLPYRHGFSSIQNDFGMWRHMEQDRLDLVHFVANYGFAPRHWRTVITLHDEINLLPLAHILRGHAKNLRVVAMMTYLHFCTRTALPRASLVLTISEYVKRRIGCLTELEGRRIVPVPHAPPLDIHRIVDGAEQDEVRTRLGMKCPFVLADALKNPGVLVRAWEKLPDALRAQHEIVFFSRSPNVLPVVSQAVSAGIARLLIRPTRHDLSALYSMAAAFVFPSWIEGFGLPLLEAMRCGAPVIASDRAAIPEVVGDAALLIDAEDADTLATYLTRVLGTPAEAESLRTRGFAWAAQYSWRKTADGILAAYRQAMELTP